MKMREDSHRVCNKLHTLFMKGCLLSSNMLSLFSCFLFLRQLSAMQ
jgi:hypothetical protein